MDFGELSLTVQHEIDQACDAFEAAWRGEVRPRVEDFLGEANGRMRAGRLAQLIAMEIQLRRREGERPNPDEYLARFPGDSVIVLSAFQRTVEVGDTDGDFLGSGAAGTPSVPATPGLTQPRPPSTLPPVEPVGSPGFEPIPDRIGKFQDIRRIGWGGFAVVYLARDPDLKREVALKVPRQGALGRYDEALLIDAISAAKLSHPGIVRIYELVRLHQGGLVIAMEYVAGTTLEKRLRTERLSPAHAAGLIRRVAEAVQHAHEHGLVHRDLKPSNVLIDLKGEPKVTDFGLAVGGETQGVPGEVAGTPAYMAPEQVRGETHRIDARTDVWALGVILYRALTGELPFPSRERAEVFDEVLHREPPSPRRINPELPSELARITTRCLSKRMDDRYESAAELAEDLADWLSADLRGLPDWTITDSGREGIGGLPDLGPAVLSKGLRPYDGEDAGYFLGLIPGPRVRGGFPESLRFWKARIESRESRTGSQTPRAFRVGLLHGPSGGGKSSIVRAGLLPRLDTMIRRVYVEASPATTEDRLLTELRQEVPGLDPQADLPKSVAAIREWRAGLEPSAKVLLVLDQFEQWLQAHPLLDQNMPLVRALRQCDGVRAQALILVRDDFWGPIWRFFKALEVPLAEGDNAASVELPDAAHARRVLVEFGRACDRLPKSDPPGPVACRFLDEAVAGLCGPDGRVVPVRLSLFNEVARRHEWTHATLRRLGGMSGIGLTYLKQTFDQPSAPAPYHARRRAAQRVLQALLPAPGAVIRGIVRPATHLGETAGLADRPHDRDELLRMLDSELRLITEVDPQGTEDGDTPGAGDAGDATASAPGERYYQLAHDDLVSSVRTWLEEEERSTSAGRARLRLATITAVWTDSPGTKRLPSLTEWLGILWHVPPGLWSAESRRMMLSASWHHARRVATAWVILIAVTLLGRLWQRQVAAESRVAQVLGFDLSALPSLFPELERDRDALIPALREAEAHPGPSAGRKRNALVLLYRFEPTPERARALRDLACVAEADDLSVLREVLASRPQAALNDDLWRILGDSSTDAPTRLRAASTLARLDPGASGWRTHASTLALDLLAEERGGLTRWFSLLDPVASVMVPALAESLVMTEPQPPVFREVTLALTERRRVPETVAAFQAILDHLDGQPEPPLAEVEARDRIAKRRSAAAAGLAELGALDRVWPLLRHDEDPRLRAFVIDRFARFAVNPRGLLDRLNTAEVDPVELQGVLMTLAEMRESRPERLSPTTLEEIATSAAALLRDHDDSGVHSAAELVLRRIGRGDLIFSATSAAGVTDAPLGRSRWYLGHNGHTFAVVRLEGGWRGTYPHEDGYDPVEARQYVQIGRTVAVSTREVTRGQIQRLRLGAEHDDSAGNTDDHPANTVTWYEAARYCNRLSDLAGLPRCYPEPIGPNMVLDADAVKAGGYRLPTEAEWELLCRAGTLTARPFGDSDVLQGRYACGWINSSDKTLPVGRLLPNELGLFDMLGNLWEWCHDADMVPDFSQSNRHVSPYPAGTPEAPAVERLVTETIEPLGIEGAPSVDTVRVTRGGAYDYANSQARSGKRSDGKPGDALNYDGFRVVRTIMSN